MPVDTTAASLFARVPRQILPTTVSADTTSAQLFGSAFDPAVASNAAGETYICGGDTVISSTGQAFAYKLSADGSTLTQLPNMPGPKVGARAAVDSNGRLYVMGGNSNGVTNATVYIYDPTGNAWATLNSPMPAARSQFAACSDSQGRIYVIGGNANDSTFNTVYRYDPTAGSWSTLTAMPVGRNLSAAAFAGGSIYVSGGSDSGGTNYSTLYRYDVAAGTWSTLANSAVVRVAHASAADNQGRILIAGGLNNAGASLGTVERFDPIAGTWTTLTAIALSTARGWVSAGVDSQGRMIIPGGAGGTNTSRTYPRTIERITPESALLVISGWRTIGALPAVRINAAASTDGSLIYCTHGVVGGSASNTGATITPTGVVTPMTNSGANNLRGAAGAFVAGKHYAIGGFDQTNTQRAEMEAYTPAGTNGAGGTWVSRAAGPTALGYQAAAVVGTSIYCVGGQSNISGQQSQACSVYDTATNVWAFFTGLPAARSQGMLVALGTRLYYLGGLDGSGNATATVYVYDTANGTGGAWSTAASLPNIVTSGSTAAFILGNRLTLMALNNSGAVYRFDGTSWISTIESAVTSSHNNGSAVAVGSLVFAVSGGSTTNVDLLDTVTAGTSPYGRRVRALQQYLAGQDPTAYALARRLPITAPSVPAWRLAGSLPQFRYGAAVTTDGTNLLVTHGYTGANVAQNSGMTVTPAGVVTTLTNAAPSAGRYYVGSVFCNGRHYVLGGLLANGSPTNVVERYTPAGNNGAEGTWSVPQVMPGSRAFVAAAALGTSFYVAGGQVNSNTSSAGVFFARFDTTTGAWTDLSSTASLPAGRTSGAMVTWNGKVYYLGGTSSGNIPQTTVFVYDPAAGANGTWTTMSQSLFEEMDLGAASIVGSTVYLSGRYFPTGTSGSEAYGVQTFDLATGAGALLNPQTTQHVGHGSAVIGTTLYLVSGNVTAAIDAIDPVGATNYLANIRRLRTIISA